MVRRIGLTGWVGIAIEQLPALHAKAIRSGGRALRVAAADILHAKVDALLGQLEATVVTALTEMVGEDTDRQPADGIESGNGAMVEDVGRAVMWGLVADVRQLLTKLAGPLLNEAAGAIAIAADDRAAMPRRSEPRASATELTPLVSVHVSDCPGPPGRLSALSVFLCKSVFYGAFVWARRVLNRPFRWFSARADGNETAVNCPSVAEGPETGAPPEVAVARDMAERLQKVLEALGKALEARLDKQVGGRLRQLGSLLLERHDDRVVPLGRLREKAVELGAPHPIRGPYQLLSRHHFYGSSASNISDGSSTRAQTWMRIGGRRSSWRRRSGPARTWTF
jgi:hypothetical protein